MTKPLGRRPPTDWEHVEKYPLRALATIPVRVPVVGGFNWYSNFDTPQKGSDGAWWIGRGDLGRIRGGHAVCFPPVGVDEPYSWWAWHDQVSEGICVGEAIVRCMALLNRYRYQPRPLYDEAQRRDEWPGEDYDGTSVRAGLDVARTLGLVVRLDGEPHYVRKEDGPFWPPRPAEGIAANRWALTTDEILVALGTTRNWVTIANSWGRSYPRRVRMPVETLERVRWEDGEFGIVTDR